MRKHWFFAIDTVGIDTWAPRSWLYRFPTRKHRQAWIDEDAGNRGVVQQRPEHPAYFAVRRVNQMLSAGEPVVFPVAIEEG